MCCVANDGSVRFTLLVLCVAAYCDGTNSYCIGALYYYCCAGALWTSFIHDDLMIDPYHEAGNAAMFINDYRCDPHNKKANRAAGKTNVNVTFLHVTYKGWPYIFIKASGAVESTAEFILDYGNGYWTDSINLHSSFEKVLPPLEALHDSKDELKQCIDTAAAAAAAAASGV
jgi:hypothetical protein